MYVSKYNVFVELNRYPELSIIQNIFHGHSTVVPKSLATYLKSAVKSGDLSALSEDTISLLMQKGFIYYSKHDEDEQIEVIYSEFKKTLPEANPSRQYQIILTYDCNLHCIYCFQKKVRKENNHALITKEQLSEIFTIILSKERANDAEVKQKDLLARVPLISIVGGEPLLDTSQSMERVADVIEFAKQNNFHYSITTNGVFLDKYIPVFRAAGYKPRDIQVTIDGTKEYHDRRRINVEGYSSFEQIVQSIDCVLAESMCISLRLNIDEMNIISISRMADYVRERQWTSYDGFSAYIAPVTDHSAVNKHYRWLKRDASLIRRIVEMFTERPELENVFTMKNFRGFQYIKRIAQKKGKVVPTIWRCEAVLGQLVFDPQGNLYTCFEGAGNEKAKIGTYSPSYIIDEQKEKVWKDLNAINNKYCRKCSNRFVCSSGCPWHIVNQEATECLPIKEEIQLAWNYFAPRVL
jgi:uncharacterized protein